MSLRSLLTRANEMSVHSIAGPLLRVVVIVVGCGPGGPPIQHGVVPGHEEAVDVVHFFGSSGDDLVEEDRHVLNITFKSCEYDDSRPGLGKRDCRGLSPSHR